jgi:hypothetical protein
MDNWIDVQYYTHFEIVNDFRSDSVPDQSGGSSEHSIRTISPSQAVKPSGHLIRQLLESLKVFDSDSLLISFCLICL